MKVRLNEALDKAGLGFTDVEAKQEIRVKKPGMREVIDVTDSVFVREKLRTGELEQVIENTVAVPEKVTAPEKPADPKK